MAMSPETTAVGLSPLERARRRHQRLTEQAHIYLRVPGWGDDLIARVQVIDDTMLRALIDRQQDQDDQLDATADLIAEAVTALYVRGDDGELVPLRVDGDEDGAPLRFDAAFGASLGIDGCETARAAVYAAFTVGEPPRVNVTALMAFADRIDRWLADTSSEIEESVVPGA